MVNFISVLVAAALFSLAFPNIIIEKGFPLALWAAYIPLFLLIYRTKARVCPFWGALYGALSMFLFNYWLASFHFSAAILLVCLFALYYAAFSLVLKLSALLLPRHGYLVQTLLWVAFEYARTLGFFGYPYGISGYSQWTLLPLVKIADIGGVWAVSLLMIFPQAFIASIINCAVHKTKFNHEPHKPHEKTPLYSESKGQKKQKNFPLRFFLQFRPLLIWFVVLCAALVYGSASKLDYSESEKIKVALVQVNSDPWKSDVREFRLELDVLRRLSDLVLSEVPPPELVVWSETAFVPSFNYHKRHRVNAESTALVLDAEAYLSAQSVPFIIGNDEGHFVTDIDGSERLAHYNAALLFADGELSPQHYYKMKLVPFSEYFPYGGAFPEIYRFMEKQVTHFWDEGQTPYVFEVNGLQFSTPICFEDSFGSISREFVLGGARLIVNMSNDSWSHSLPGQNQHLGMAVFRAIENRRSLVRATTSGQTCAIDPNGKIIAEAEPFIETAISVEAPLISSRTLYTRLGDMLPLVCAGLAALGLILGIIYTIMRCRGHSMPSVL
jgi:apolipoprotein N-acyltransferase